MFFQRKLALMFLFSMTLCVHPTNVQNYLFISPNILSRITPFILQTDGNESGTDMYTIKPFCSESVRSTVIFPSNYSDFCSDKSFTGQIDKLNNILMSLQLTLISESIVSRSIIFQFFDQNNVALFSSSLSLTIASQIPLTVFTSNIKINSNPKNSNQQLPVLSIDPIYLLSFDKNALLVHTDSLISLNFFFQQNILYIDFNPIYKSQIPFSLSLSISDTNTKLVSDLLLFRMVSELPETERTSKPGLIPFVILIIIIALVVGIAIKLIHLRQRNQNLNLQGSINGKKLANINTSISNDIQDKTVVLTQSIVTWNKKLLDKHKHKHNNDSQEDTHMNIMSKNKSRTGEPSITPGEFGKEVSRRYKAFDEISEIDIEAGELKSPSSSLGNSSFLDDFNL